jgi:hypothetical protein
MVVMMVLIDSSNEDRHAICSSPSFGLPLFTATVTTAGAAGFPPAAAGWWTWRSRLAGAAVSRITGMDEQHTVCALPSCSLIGAHLLVAIAPYLGKGRHGFWVQPLPAAPSLPASAAVL